MKTLVAIFCLFVSLNANAQTVNIMKSRARALITAQPLNVCVWTGAQEVKTQAKVELGITYVDGGTNVTTDITAYCEAFNSASEYALLGDGNGFDLHGTDVVCAAGVCTARTDLQLFAHRQLAGAAGTEKWFWVLERIPGEQMNCYFCGLNSVVGDLLTVTWRTVTP